MMRTFLVGLTIVSACGLAGCTKESDKGGPGATQAAKSNEDAKNAEDMMFTAKPPTITTTVQQGGRDEVTLSIDRGDKFKETVTLTFKPPAGVTVNPATASIPADSEEAKVTIEAAADAAPGDTHVDVTFTPETGKAVPKTFPIKVTEK